MQENRELYLRDDGEWSLYPQLITCTDKGTQEQKYTDDIDYYKAFEKMHDDFTLDEVLELSYTDDQIGRLGEVQGLKPSDFDEIYNYVVNGVVKDDSTIFMAKNTAKLKEIIDTLFGGV